MCVEKIYRQIGYNRSARHEAIRYIVVHDTGNTSAGADAEAHYIYFDNGNRNSSADIFVGDRSVWYVNDYTKYCTWHCGDGGGIYGITNQNSVGVELCINAGSNYEKALQNMAEVVIELMEELGIPIERVVRHYDASRKCCPGSMAANDWKIWKEFQEMLKGELTMSRYEELKRETEDLTETVKQLAVQVSDLQNPMIYNYIDDNMPKWAREAVRWAVDGGLIHGDGSGLALTEEKLWMLVVFYRAVSRWKGGAK